MWFWVALLLFIALIFSLFYLFKFARIILNIEDGLEECLDTLDERYNSISKILEIPIFFDSLEVRKVIDDINKSRYAVLKVANILSFKQSYKNLIEIKNAEKTD
tara:strand:- start:841 stop:1152 length:312 start_codon:yes stop_codon:yes gene_type:complete